MRNYLRILLLLCALGIVVLAGCVSAPSRKSATEAYQTGFQDMANGANTNALNDFSEAIKRDPRFVSAYSSRAQLEVTLGNFHAALADWTRVIELQPTNESALLMRGVTRLQLNDYEAAGNDLNRAISLAPDDVRARDYRGLLRANEQDWDGAKADFSEVIQANPGYASAYRDRAAAEIMARDYEDGMDDASNALQLDPGNAWEAYHLLARVKVSLKDYPGAKADAYELVKLDPSEVKSYFARAEIEIICDDFTGASNDLRTALLMSPTNASIYAYRAMLERKYREPAAALADLGRMQALVPQSSRDPEMYEALGFAQEDLHQWRPALMNFRKAMAYNSPPKDGIPLQIFILQCRLGQRSQAAKDLAAYLHSIPVSQTNDWTSSIANFLAGNLSEKDFLAQAVATAKRRTDISGQTCDAYYFEGMKHLLAGDKAGAAERFQKCVNTREDNSYNYMNAIAELDDLKLPTSRSLSNPGS